MLVRFDNQVGNLAATALSLALDLDPGKPLRELEFPGVGLRLCLLGGAHQA